MIALLIIVGYVLIGLATTWVEAWRELDELEVVFVHKSNSDVRYEVRGPHPLTFPSGSYREEAVRTGLLIGALWPVSVPMFTLIWLGKLLIKGVARSIPVAAEKRAAELTELEHLRKQAKEYGLPT